MYVCMSGRCWTGHDFLFSIYPWLSERFLLFLCPLLPLLSAERTSCPFPPPPSPLFFSDSSMWVNKKKQCAPYMCGTCGTGWCYLFLVFWGFFSSSPLSPTFLHHVSYCLLQHTLYFVLPNPHPSFFSVSLTLHCLWVKETEWMICTCNFVYCVCVYVFYVVGFDKYKFLHMLLHLLGVCISFCFFVFFVVVCLLVCLCVLCAWVARVLWHDVVSQFTRISAHMAKTVVLDLAYKPVNKIQSYLLYCMHYWPFP